MVKTAKISTQGAVVRIQTLTFEFLLKFCTVELIVAADGLLVVCLDGLDLFLVFDVKLIELISILCCAEVGSILKDRDLKYLLDFHATMAFQVDLSRLDGDVIA